MCVAGEGYGVKNEDTRYFLENIDFQMNRGTLLEKMAMSMAVYEGFALEVIWARNGKKIASVRILPFENIRVGTPNAYGEVSEYFYSTTWESGAGTPTPLPSFDPSKSKSHPKQILYISTENPLSLFYPIPAYYSSLKFILTEKQLATHHLSAATNNFLPSALITFIGNPTDEERRKNKELFKRNFEGAENSGSTIIAYAESADEKLQIDTINTNNVVDIYINCAEECKQRIITSHNIVSPSLLAISQDSSLFGNAEELKISFDLFQNTKIKHYQKIIEKNMNLILKYAGFADDRYTIIPFQLFTPENVDKSAQAEAGKITDETITEQDIENDVSDETE
jgi:hypothetical protein